MLSQAAKRVRSGSATMTAASATRRNMGSFADFKLNNLQGTEVSMSSYVGKPTLILNVATLWGTTKADFKAMNDLKLKKNN